MSRATQDAATLRIAPCTQLSCSAVELSRTFHSRYSLRSCGPTTPAGPEPRWFGLLPGRSPLLGESLLFSFPPGTKMFQFPGLASLAGCRAVSPAGCPIRRSPDHGPFAPPRSLSQLVTSFIACKSQGIRHTPLPTFRRGTRRHAARPCTYTFSCTCEIVSASRFDFASLAFRLSQHVNDRSRDPPDNNRGTRTCGE